MKSLIAILVLLLFAAIAKADNSWELLGPELTWHISDSGNSKSYDHVLTENGKLLYTPNIGFKKIHVDKYDGYMSFTAFRSLNEIGSPIYGAYGGAGWRAMHMLYLGVVYGGYIQNNEDFKAKGIAPVSAAGDTNAFVPILGFEINSHFDIDKHWFIGWNNMITQTMTQHNLSLGYNY